MRKTLTKLVLGLALLGFVIPTTGCRPRSGRGGPSSDWGFDIGIGDLFGGWFADDGCCGDYGYYEDEYYYEDDWGWGDYGYSGFDPKVKRGDRRP